MAKTSKVLSPRNCYIRRKYWKKNNRNQYLKAKIDYVDTIIFPTTQIAGAPYLRSRTGQNPMINFNNILSLDEMGKYRALFGFYRIYAASMMIIPCKQSPQIGDDSPVGHVFLTLNPSRQNAPSIDEAKASNNSLMCPMDGVARKFITF